MKDIFKSVKQQKCFDMADNAIDAIFIKDLNRKYIYINPAMKKLFGSSYKKIIGKKPGEVFSKEDAKKVNRVDNLCYQGEEVNLIEELTISGKKYFFHTIQKPLRDEENKIIGVLGIVRDMTKYKKVEAELIKEKERAESYLRIAGVIMVALDREGNITMINKKGDEIFGYKSGELVGKNWFKTCLPKESRNQVKLFFSRLIQNKIKSIDNFENEVITKTGIRRIINWHNTLIKDNQGKIIGVLSSGDDITERKLIEEQYKNFLELTPRGVHIYQIIGDKLILKGVNLAASRITGVDNKKLIGKEILTAFPGLKNTLIPQIYRQVAKTGKSWQGEVPYEHGKIKGYFEVIAFRLTDNKMAVSFLDITEQKIMARQIEQSEKNYSALVEKSSDGIVVVQEGLIKYVNPSLLNMGDFSKEDVIGKRMINFISLPDKTKVIKNYQDLLTGKSSSFRSEIYVLGNHNRILPVEVSGSLVSFEDKPAVMAIIRDISRAKEIDKMKSEFISLASHQLRTPLTGIKWMGQLLLKGRAGELTLKQLDFINQIVDSNERMISLINDLLDVSHIETGENFSIDRKSNDLIVAVKEVIVTQKVQADLKNIKIILNKEIPKSLIFSFDKVKVMQVISNLLNNSIKYSPKSKKIIVGIKKDNNKIIVSIKDFGFGIPKLAQASIFTRFFRADNIATISTQGTGLGLYIARGIVEAHGGKIWFESKENKGSVFYFSLPFKK